MSADVTSIPLGRRRVVRLLRANGWDEESIGDVALMTSELATNAVQHARTEYTLTVDLAVQRLRVDVTDAGATLPALNSAHEPEASGGRGLAIVAALADCWGFESITGGKRVWFEARPNLC